MKIEKFNHKCKIFENKMYVENNKKLQSSF